MKLKWLSMLLALALVFSLAPAMALAEEKTVADATELKDAIESAAPGDTIKLTAGKEYNLASLGNALTINETLTITCEGGTAIFKGDPDNANGASNGAFKISGASGVTVTLQGINFVDFGGNTTSGNVIIAGQDGELFGGTLNITNCSFSNFGKNGITVKGGKADISNVIVDAGSEVRNRAPNGIQIDHGATATINGCTIKNSDSTHEEWSATGILTLRGGQTTASNITFENCESAFHVTEGYDSGTEQTTGSSSSITGSTFKNCETAIANDTGTLGSSTSNTITPPTGTKLTTEYIDQLPEGTTIELTGNVELDAMLNINTNDITLDLGGHIITASEDFSGAENNSHLVNVHGDNVTIKNGTLKTTEKNKHALNVYQTTGAVIENLTIDHSVSLGGAPIIVNASELTVKGSLSMTLGEKSWYGINVDPKGTSASLTFEAGSQVTMTGKDEDVVRLDGDPDNITIVNAADAGLAEDEDGNYILAQNPEPQPPTPPTSGGGWDDTLWPNILQHPQSVSAPAGSLATFSVVANGGPLSYQWQVDRRDGKGFVSIPGATGATLTVGPVTGAENGYQYRCAVTLYGATMYSGAGQLFVTAGMIPKTGDMPGSPALLLALAGLGLAAWVVARRRAG